MASFSNSIRQLNHYQWLCLLILYLSAFNWHSINGQYDFQFETNTDDDLQVVFTEPIDVVANNQSRITPYEKDVSSCPNTQKKLILSLILRTNSWDDILSVKKDRALKKLSNFFGIPKEYISADNVYKRNIQEMNKYATVKGNSQLGSYKKLGRIAFMIGCGTKYFPTGQLIANQIAQQMQIGSINDISGLDFGWWVIWQKQVIGRTPRNRRDILLDKEGSGEDEDYYYEDSDDDEAITEVPSIEHPHRHHHGDEKPNTDRDSNSIKTAFDPPIDSPRTSIIEPEATQIDPDIQESVSKLELDITKTIENNNNKLKEVQEEIERYKQPTNPLMTMETYIDSDEIGQMPPIESIEDDLDNTSEDYVVEDVAQARKTTTTELPMQENSKETIKEIVTTSLPIYEIETSTEFLTKATTIQSMVEPVVTKTVSTTITTTKSETDETPSVPSTTTSSSTTTTQIPTTTTTTSTTTTIISTIVTIDDVHAKISVTTTPDTPTKVTDPIDIVVTEQTPTTVPSITEKTTGKLDATTAQAKAITEQDDYDETDYDDYDDEFKNVMRTTQSTTVQTTTPKTTVSITVPPQTTTLATSPQTTSTTEKIPTTEYIEPEPVNYAPIIKNRLPKQPVTAGKPFSYIVPLETFFDIEDGTNLKLELLDKNDNPLKANSWIQFNTKTREIYGLPLEDAVSKWQFKLRATDRANESVVETVDISVQQHKAHRSANHEISIGIKLNEKFASNIDWQIQLIRGIVEVLGDNSLSSVVVREVRHSIHDVNAATFIYTNETLPKDKCPEEKLDELFQRLTVENLSNSVSPDITVKSVSGKPIGPCLKIEQPKSKLPKPTPHTTKNYPPVPRNQVDRVNATVGQLLVFKVPSDTFYDPEDNTDLKLSLLSIDRTPLDPKHWLQFDSKNQEFYGIPMASDAGQKEYLLVAEDREGKSATDALVVVVSHPQHREYNTLFEMSLGMPHDEFDNAAVQRRFVERVSAVFGDPTTSNIQVKSHHKIHQGKTLVNYYNTTLYRTYNVCPNENIEQLKRILVQQDGKVRHRVKDAIGNEFDLMKVTFTPFGACSDIEERIHHAGIPIKPDDSSSSSFKDDYLLTFVLPAVIIVAMILLASIIACVLHRRRMTGKMELGDEEERRSFRSKGIPVIFQDELDEKPEMGNKSPVILKDEKPPLLPPSYNSTNPDEHEDCDEYVPPPAVVINGRESRGKSPVTPSYRKPPPYVSP